MPGRRRIPRGDSHGSRTIGAEHTSGAVRGGGRGTGASAGIGAAQCVGAADASGRGGEGVATEVRDEGAAVGEDLRELCKALPHPFDRRISPELFLFYELSKQLAHLAVGGHQGFPPERRGTVYLAERFAIALGPRPQVAFFLEAMQ